MIGVNHLMCELALMLILVWFELLDLHILVGESKFVIDKKGWRMSVYVPCFQTSEDIHEEILLSNLEGGWCCFLPWL